MATLTELVKEHGEGNVIKMVESYITARERRQKYASTPEAKAASAARREKQAKEMVAFRKWQTDQKKR